MTLYFFQSIKKSLVVFAKQFTDLSIIRKATDGSETKTINVETIIANKQKFYKRINKKDQSVRLVLPAISIWNENITYNVDRQKNPFFGSKAFSKESDGIMKYMRSPSPVTMEMTVRMATVYYSDMMQIIETILPEYQPKVTKRVNLIPGLDCGIDMAIVFTGLSQNFDLEMDESPDSLRMLEADLSFEVHTYMFPPIEEKYIAKNIMLLNGSQQIDVHDDNSPDDIVNSGAITTTDYSRELISSVELEDTEINYSGVYRLDASAIIATDQEDFLIYDSDGKSCPFVFEYDNGELYGNDELVPSFLTLTKTGYIFVQAQHELGEDIPEKYRFEYWSNHHKNYEYGHNVLHVYEDFNYKSLKNLQIDWKTEISKFYVDSGTLYLRSFIAGFDNMLRVYPKKIDSHFSTIDIGINSFTSEEDKILCGMSDRNDQWCYVKTTADNLQYDICEFDGTTETVVDTVTLTSQVSLVKFTQAGSTITVALNGESSTDLVNTYSIPWMGNDFENNYIRYRFLKIY